MSKGRHLVHIAGTGFIWQRWPDIVPPDQFATADFFKIRDNIDRAVLDFDFIQNESFPFDVELPAFFYGDGLTVRLSWLSDREMLGAVRWKVSVKLFSDLASLDIEKSAIGSIDRPLYMQETVISFDRDELPVHAGDQLRIIITRDAVNEADTLMSDAMLCAVVVDETPPEAHVSLSMVANSERER